MMTDIRTILERRIAGWESLGHPSVLERFVLRNGKVFKPVARPSSLKQQAPGMCFQNASLALDRGVDGIYVEGLATPSFSTDLVLEHAWIGQGDKAIDLTWDNPRACQYIGVEFDNKVRIDRQLATGYYGLLDIGRGHEIEFMFSIDPELKQIVETIIGHEIKLKAA